MSYMFCRYLPHTMSTYIHALMQSHRLPPTKSVICNHSAILSILLENMTLASTKLSLTSNYLNLASNLASFSRVPKELYEALVGKPRCGCALCTNKVFSQSMCQHTDIQLAKVCFSIPQSSFKFEILLWTYTSCPPASLVQRTYLLPSEGQNIQKEKEKKK